MDNLVPACPRCNSGKSDRTEQEARRFFVLSMLDWPNFSPKQLEWMRGYGVDLRPFDEAILPSDRRAAEMQPRLQNGVKSENASKNPVNADFAPPCVAEATQ